MDSSIKIYYKNGQLKEEINYKDGKMEGITKVYNENGQLISEKVYKDDILIRVNK